ncbi:AP-5 complex subunit mu-like [Chenopodium quinoa]|uniref:AP-5 complex subunit mu-like n=1 Tax=Chenopodium quinoa TaxID=63459 RepID=UPI000B77BB24|nr:AP-5 complex subunit mu-like [Chenopodium quinoa]
MPTTTSNICSKCNIRALWILNNVDFVVFSRRFPTVERRWRAACKSDDEKVVDGSSDKPTVSTSLPNDSEFSEAFTNRRKREGSARGSGIRVAESVQGSDSWVDDPIVRHIISLHIDHEEGEGYMLWPLVFHVKGPYCILVLPLVEPKHVKAYEGLCKRSDCGTAIGMDPNLSSLLFDLPSITGAFMLAHVIGDIITGDFAEPEIAVSASPSVGGLLDSLTGSIGISSISARGKPVPASVPNSTASPASLAGSVLSDAQKAGSRPLEKDALQSFISSSMPFGTLLDLSYSNLSAIRLNGFSATDVPPADVKQPAWKPYLYRGKQRILFTIYETINASMYDRDEIPDSISISGQVNCRAELEGLPDVSFPLTGLINSRVEVLSFHPCVQVPEHGIDKQSLVFSPPFGNFTLMRYLTFCNLGPPVKGFYQLSMVSENEGAFLFKLRLMDGYKAPLAMEFCTITMPFPRRKVVSFSGTPSIGIVSSTDHSIEWKIITSGRGASGKSVEATFPGTVKFARLQTQNSLGSVRGTRYDEDSDTEMENANNGVNIEEFLEEKMRKDLPPIDLEEPFCWQAYDYAKVSFKIMGASSTGMSVDTKHVNIYPAVKAPIEFSTQVTSGDYILWNTLGKCPSAAMPTA